jgi:gamma-glutamyltranspeptidase/glutathione hydrolase
MRRLADEGPDHFLTGEWAQHFVQRANELGWPITPAHMTAIPPDWKNGTRYRHRDVEIVQLSPPQRQAVFCAMVLGILDELDARSLGHYTESADALYFFAHALRRAGVECGLVHDPKTHASPAAVLMSRELHRLFAQVLRESRSRVDLTRHVELVSSPMALAAAGVAARQGSPEGSCELSIVDERGNWVQMMNTLQSGGIPGEVVDGVPMVGSHVELRLTSEIAGWLTGGGRMRRSLTNTIVLRDGKPFWSLGTPGNTYCTVPQVLSNVLDYGMDPYAAEDAPRMLPLDDDYRLKVESRIGDPVIRGLAKLGVLVDPLPRYDWHMGSYQMCWRTEDDTLRSCVGPRRAGAAAAL